MKKFICLAFILFGAIGIFAQGAEKTIEKSEFDAVSINSLKKFAGQSFRQTEIYQDVLPVSRENKYSSKLIMEFTSAPTRMSSVYEVNSSMGRKKTETIRVGDKIYTRIDGGEWAEEKPDVRQKFENKLKMLEEQIEYKSLGTEKLDNQTTSVYAKIQRQKLVNETNKSEMYVTTTTKYWFGEDGGRLKEEMQSERRIKSEKAPSESVSSSVKVTLWELDPSIKIEAPIAEK